MVITNITFKNFRSFGNDTQKLELNTDKGELILVTGKNGNGKSSILQTFEYCYFGKVKGKKKKYLPNGSLPNRINNSSLETYSEFYLGKKRYEVQRGLKPNFLNLKIEGNDFDKAGKKNINQEIEAITGFDIDTFKSFISVSVNDFKNFISLSAEDKRNLLDKLFNLNKINELSKILKEMKRNNENDIQTFNKEIESYENSINSIQQSIEKTKNQANEDLNTQLEEYKNEIYNNKEKFYQMQEKIQNLENKKEQTNQKNEQYREKLKEIEYAIRKKKEELELYEQNKCPKCGSDLTTHDHQEHKRQIENSLEKEKEIYQQVKEKLNKIKEGDQKINETLEKYNNSYYELKSYLKELKEKLNSAKEENHINYKKNIQEFENSLKELEEKKKEIEEKFTEAKSDKMIYKKLEELFSEKGIKKTIIHNIVKPINSFIAENLHFLGMPFEVQLDDSFDAKIYVLGKEIEPDSLSTGEEKKINICIMLAYIKLIRMKKYINILFLDEIFSSIDIEGINDILALIQNFARDSKVNIFLVHHSQLNNEPFDRVLHIEKDITSEIKEMKINN